jgi:uncharacterized LabA/DUF88 family protein
VDLDRKPRIALLIDADNVPQENVTRALGSLAAVGETTIRRAYGNWFDSRLKRWEALLKANSIRPIQQFGYTKGKNATDMALVIDAVSLLHTDRPDAFAIVSSDADFTPLVIHLRERGLPVHGFGRPDTPKPFMDACTTFETIEPAATKRAAKAEDASTDVGERLRTAVAAAQGKDGWARIQAVRAQLGPKTAFNPGDYGAATLTKLLKATGGFELRDEGSTSVRVRVAKRASGQG